MKGIFTALAAIFIFCACEEESRDYDRYKKQPRDPGNAKATERTPPDETKEIEEEKGAMRAINDSLAYAKIQESSLLSFNFGEHFEHEEKLRDYRYVETVERTTLPDGTREIKEKKSVIRAINDSLAYVKAQDSFLLALDFEERFLEKELMPYYERPIGFRLYDDGGKDISDAQFATNNEKTEEIEKLVDLHDVMLKTIRLVAIEKEKRIEKLINEFFRVEGDEFSSDNPVFYTPKSASKYRNVNDVHCYLVKTKNSPIALRLVIQCATNWLFTERIIFSIDGTVYHFVPSNVKNGYNKKGMWEWCDEHIKTEEHMSLIEALANAKQAKVKLEGSIYCDIKAIGTEQIKGIKRSLDLYKAMNGRWKK